MIDDITDSFTRVIQDFVEFIPNLVVAILLLIVGKIVARFVTGLFHKLLTRLNFDGVVDKSGLGIHVERAGYKDSGLLLAKIVGWIIMLVFVQMAVGALGIDSIENLVNELVAWIPNVIIAIVLVVITGAVANFVKGLLAPAMDDVAGGETFLKVIVAAIWVLGGMMAIDQLGFGRDIIDQLWTALTTGLAAILVIKFGIGGIWAARDRFWPKVYDALEK
jgi:hypothetical protein